MSELVDGDTISNRYAHNEVIMFSIPPSGSFVRAHLQAAAVKSEAGGRQEAGHCLPLRPAVLHLPSAILHAPPSRPPRTSIITTDNTRPHAQSLYVAPETKPRFMRTLCACAQQLTHAQPTRLPLRSTRRIETTTAHWTRQRA